MDKEQIGIFWKKKNVVFGISPNLNDSFCILPIKIWMDQTTNTWNKIQK